MSYITRTNSIVMVDQTCLREAVHRLGGTVSGISSKSASIRINNKNWALQRLKNGSFQFSSANRHEVAKATEMFRELGNAYQAIIKERKEAEERERKRIAKLQEDLQRLTDQASFEGIKHEELELDRSQIQKELQASEQTLSELQLKSAELEKSRESYISITKQQVEEKAKEGSWGLAAMQDDPNKRRTRIQLRRKVKN